MTHFVKRGNTIKLAPTGTIDVTEHLPVGTYVVSFDSVSQEFFLTETDDMTVPEKIYGTDPSVRADRVINTFRSRSSSTGVLMTGEKGSGKTMLTKLISRKLRESGVPTIIVNAGFTDPNFIELFSNLTTPCMVVFDEFEKVYNEQNDQQFLLTLLDGTVATKHMFVLTTNEAPSKYFLNRPGRIFYKFNYGSIDASVVEDYTNKNLLNQDHKQGLIDLTNMFNTFNFDMLASLVEEMNRYGEDARTCSESMNLSPSVDDFEYQVQVLFDGLPFEGIHYPYSITCSPLEDTIQICLRESPNKKQRFKKDTEPDFLMKPENIKSIANGGKIYSSIQVEDHEIMAVFTKQKTFNYRNLY